MGFIVDDEQTDVFLDPRRGITLERKVEGETIYVNWPNGDRRMSITQAHAIETWLGDGLIELEDEE